MLIYLTSLLQIAFTSVVYPSLIFAYMGQAAYLSKHHNIAQDYHFGFYESVPGRWCNSFFLREKVDDSEFSANWQFSFFCFPEKLRWPVLVIAILAAVVGSQAIITGTFSIIKQCSSLSCFPRVKVIHTSSKIHGQIYIPEINWLLMMLCLAVTICFRDTKRLGHAAGMTLITIYVCITFAAIWYGTRSIKRMQFLRRCNHNFSGEECKSK